jgi:RES domain-containing protein
MLIRRLARAAYPALDGEGARRWGGRWNRPGISVVYAAENLSLCLLEALVHADPDLLPDDLTAFDIDVPDDLYAQAETDAQSLNLPGDWADDIDVSREVGARWADTGSVLLIVPSVIVPIECCVLLNPRHPDAERIRVIGQTPFAFDPRLFR